MRWRRDHVSNDVIDRRGQRGSAGGGGTSPLLSLLPILMRSKWGWLIGLLLLGAYFFTDMFDTPGGEHAVGHDSTVPGGTEGSEQVQFVSFVLDDSQQTWQRLFADSGQHYQNAKLVLFTDRTQSGCGQGQAATGPFYCPLDQRVYIDLGFYRALEQRFGAPGDFAQAYVIAHEIGHHVQNLLGASERVHRAPQSAQQGAGGLSVRLELQADCYAGVWAHSTDRRQILEAGDMEEGLQAAAAIGDDRLQRASTGTIQPEAWTHGSSAQRVHWFKRGFDTGDPSTCNTFEVETL